MDAPDRAITCLQPSRYTQVVRLLLWVGRDGGVEGPEGDIGPRVGIAKEGAHATVVTGAELATAGDAGV